MPTSELKESGPMPDNSKIGACREKYWNELTDYEKIERMRLMVKRQKHEIEGLQRALAICAEWFQSHGHLENEIIFRGSIFGNSGGSVIGGANDLRSLIMGYHPPSNAPRNKDEEYF